jgi:hypothetical protein
MLYIGLHFGRLPLAVPDFLKVNAAVVLTASTTTLVVWQTASFAHANAFPVWVSLIAEIAAGALSFTFSFALAWLWLRRMAAFVAIKAHLPLLERIERIYPTALIGRRRAA